MKPTGLTARQVMDLLWHYYAPYTWKPRYDAITELIFTILSQHTSDYNSERAFKSLMDTFGSLEEVANADIEAIQKAINTGGLAKTKAPRIKYALHMVMTLCGSLDLSFLKQLPLAEAKAWLRQIPGIGPKSAAIVLCFSLGMPAIAVDTHVYRVAKRLALIGPKVTADQAHGILEDSVPLTLRYPFHVALISHGRLVCKAQSPKCNECALAHRCPSKPIFQKPKTIG